MSKKIKLHESLDGVIDNGDGTFTISREKLIDLVHGQAFLEVYDEAGVDEEWSGMDQAYPEVLGSDYDSAWCYAKDQVAAFAGKARD